MKVLAVDLGGTKTLVQLVALGGEWPLVVCERRYASAEFESFEALLERFLERADTNDLHAACIAVAGPVSARDGRQVANVTNLPWTLDSAALAARLEIERCRLVNDFVAAAYGIDEVDAGHLVQLQAGEPEPGGSRAVIGAGTGLGHAILVGRGEQMRCLPSEAGHVAFAPGSTRLDDAQLKRLESLAKALNDRPALRLNITGRALAATDAEALHRGKLDAKLRAAKARELSRGGRSVDPQSVTVAADERERLIGVVYEDEDIAGKPRNFLGMAKSIPPEQMEELLMGSIDVQDKDLRQLAEDRAGAVRDHLAEQGKVPGERLFLAAPLIDGSGDTKLLPSRVDFSLK